MVYFNIDYKPICYIGNMCFSLCVFQSLKRIDHCQISRIKELNEEKKQFSLLMKRRLAQGTIRQTSLGRERESRHSCSISHFSDLSSVKSSTQSFDTLSSASIYSTERPASLVLSSTVCFDGASRMRVSMKKVFTCLIITFLLNQP